jgi:hypothetical protein
VNAGRSAGACEGARAHHRGATRSDLSSREHAGARRLFQAPGRGHDRPMA